MITFAEFCANTGDAPDPIVTELATVDHAARPDTSPPANPPVAPEPLTEAAAPPLEDDVSYVIYRDRAESFVCELRVEGVALAGVDVRLVLESDDWNLFFTGSVDAAGRCTIPLKKLPILREGLAGTARIEVVADDTRFVPWESPFTVCASRKVSVVVERRDPPKAPTVTIIR